MRIAICDDDNKIQEILREKLDGICQENGNVCQILCYSSGEELLEAGCGGQEPDILFLDIQMPGRDGMEIAEELRRRQWDTVLIFVTALSEYVYDAFDVGAFHYLVKPIREDKLRKVFLKALAQCEKSEKRQKDECPAMLFVKRGGVSTAIPIDSIIYAEVFNRKITLHTTGGNVEYYGKMTDLSQKVGDNFYRTHRSYLVNMKYVEKYDAATIWLEQGTALMSKKQFAGFVRQYMHYISRRGTAE